MPTATQNQDGTWTINGLKWVKETGTVKPIPDDLVFTGTISYNNKDAVQVNIEKNGTNYQTDWKTMLGSKLDVNLLVLQCGDVTRKIDDKWYTYKAKSNFTTEDIHPFEVELNATCTNTTPGSDGGSATLNITANTSWSVECDDWITISPTEGTSEVAQAQVTYVENTGTDTRTGRISVYAGDKYVDISIEQSGFVPEISITAPATIGATATSISYTVTTNVDAVTVKCSNEQTSTELSGTFTIPANETTEPIEYVITATCTNYPTITTSVTVTQAGNSSLPSPTINSTGVSYESYGPPTPTTPTWYLKNTSTSRGLYGEWTSDTPSQTVAGDLEVGETQDQYTTTPITLLSYDGTVTSGQASSVSFRNIRTGASGTMTVDSSGVHVSWSGSMTINEGDTVEVTIE